MLEINKIYNEDCIGEKGMCLIEDNSVDLCITDPPYKLTSGGCKGGLKIEFNQVSEKEKQSGVMFQIPEFKDWFPQVYRVLKDGGHFYCMCNDKHLENVLKVGRESGFKELNVLVWDKGMHTPLGYYMKNIEFIVLFRKGYAKKINNMGSKALISIRGVFGNKVHPSEKPTELFEHLILNSSQENEIVLDPFLGCGTTAISSLNTKRKYIGFELDNTYYNLASERINNIKP
jgi:site-specific DNA-methyltransferase (adenine-specific)